MAIEAAGAKLLLLPKYFPDLNPIEKSFATRKHYLRTAAERPLDTVCTASAQILDMTSALECANYLANAGYVRT